MTVKQFFKSKTFRCIVVLLCIALVSGALLSIMNDVLYVSAEERVQRTIKKIYGTQIGYDKEGVQFDVYQTDNGSVDEIYPLEDGNYLAKATGNHGYKEGTVTIWCVARYDGGEFVGVDNVSIASYEKQTLMGMFTSSVLSGFVGHDELDIHVVSGATYSETAVKNAFNSVMVYFRDLKEVQQ